MITPEIKLSENLKALRKTKGLSQRDLAKRVGLTQRMIALYENNASGITLQTLAQIAKAFNVSLSTLLGSGPKNKEAFNIDTRILKRVQQIKSLPESEQLALYKIIDGLVEKHNDKNGKDT